jgi:toxin FitB
MILLDTYVISEAMRPLPAAAVMNWLSLQPTFGVATTTISIAEIGFGLARLPFGRRRTERERLFRSILERSFGDRVFSFDRLAANAYGELVATRERSGRRLEGADAFIAAIAASRGLAIATRDIGGFDGCGVELIDPWAD